MNIYSRSLTSLRRCLFVISYVTLEIVTLALGTCVAKLQHKVDCPWLQLIVNCGEAVTIHVDWVVPNNSDTLQNFQKASYFVSGMM